MVVVDTMVLVFGEVVVDVVGLMVLVVVEEAGEGSMGATSSEEKSLSLRCIISGSNGYVVGPGSYLGIRGVAVRRCSVTKIT